MSKDFNAGDAGVLEFLELRPWHRLIDLTDAAVGGSRQREIDLTDEEPAFRDGHSALPGVVADDLLTVGLVAATPAQRLAKRALDVTVSAVLLILLMPVLLVTMVAVKLSSAGPVFYVQERVGRGGLPFRMLKFRSMYVDAEARRAELDAFNEATGPVFKVRRDPRVTPVGRVLRKLSIDELPQLVNVLRGEMSLVGPRPPLPSEYASYGNAELRRLLVTPGLTCIWQVSGRSDVAFADWVEMDVEYMRSWTLWLDVVLLVRTVPAVLGGRGAY